MSCEHFNFHSAVRVGRITKVEGGPAYKFIAELSIHCEDCGEYFAFLGLPVGSFNSKPSVSADFQQIRMPIAPAKDVASMADGASQTAVYEMPDK